MKMFASINTTFIRSKIDWQTFTMRGEAVIDEKYNKIGLPVLMSLPHIKKSSKFEEIVLSS